VTSFTLDGINPSPVLLKNNFKKRLDAAKEAALLGGGEGDCTLITSIYMITTICWG